MSLEIYVANVIFKRFEAQSCENARIAINHVCFSVITLKEFEHAAFVLVFKHLPRDSSNV